MKQVKKVMMIAALLSVIFVAQSIVAESGVEIDDSDDVIVFVGSEEGESQETTSELPSADIVEVSYDRVDGGTEVTVEFEVNSRGTVQETVNIMTIDDPSNIDFLSDPTAVAYQIIVFTDQSEYSVDYMNGNCTVNAEQIAFTIDDNTFTATFDLDEANETITKIGAQSMFLEFDLTSLEYKIYMDAAPDSFFVVAEIYAPATAESGEQIEFSGITTNLADFLGMGTSDTEYTYKWDFDDGSSGTGESVTHSYDLPGTYTVELTVTDAEGTETSTTKEIVITQASSSNNGNQNNGNNNDNGGDSEDSPIFLFVAIIAIIVVIGVIALIVVIRR